MSPKQEIYRDMLRVILPSLRNGQSQSWWRKIRNQSDRYDSELIHNLYNSLFEGDFTDHDIHFLNFQARWYYENGKTSYNYPYLRKLITELFLFIYRKN